MDGIIVLASKPLATPATTLGQYETWIRDGELNKSVFHTSLIARARVESQFANNVANIYFVIGTCSWSDLPRSCMTICSRCVHSNLWTCVYFLSLIWWFIVSIRGTSQPRKEKPRLTGTYLGDAYMEIKVRNCVCDIPGSAFNLSLVILD